MAEWYEFPEESPVPVMPGPKLALVNAVPREEMIRQVEEEIHLGAASILNDALHFMDVVPGPLDPETGEPTDPVPPAAWVAELGEEGAQRRLRTATLALSSSKDAPIGLKLAKDTLVGMAKVRAKENQAPKTLNMVVVHMTGNLPKFDEIEVEPQR